MHRSLAQRVDLGDHERGETSVVVVDDHRTFTDLLVLALTAQQGLRCAGTAAGVAEAITLVDEVRPDVAIMDVNMPDGDGIDAAAELLARHPELRVIVLTAQADSVLMRRAAEAGACCLLPKDGSLPDLLAAIAHAQRGGLVVHPVLLKRLMAAGSVASTRVTLLTRREQEVLRMLARGLDVRTIARELAISLNTCRGYVKTLLMKLGAHSQLEAVAIARRQGLLHVGADI